MQLFYTATFACECHWPAGKNVTDLAHGKKMFFIIFFKHYWPDQAVWIACFAPEKESDQKLLGLFLHIGSI